VRTHLFDRLSSEQVGQLREICEAVTSGLRDDAEGRDLLVQDDEAQDRAEGVRVVGMPDAGDPATNGCTSDTVGD
jgi:hypothetical protein